MGCLQKIRDHVGVRDYLIPYLFLNVVIFLMIKIACWNPKCRQTNESQRWFPSAQ